MAGRARIGTAALNLIFKNSAGEKGTFLLVGDVPDGPLWGLDFDKGRYFV